MDGGPGHESRVTGRGIRVGRTYVIQMEESRTRLEPLGPRLAARDPRLANPSIYPQLPPQLRPQRDPPSAYDGPLDDDIAAFLE
jgi:hypothetical protein